MKKLYTLLSLVLLMSCTLIPTPMAKLIPSTFDATPLGETGTYEGYETSLGTTEAHLLNAPRIKPINGKIVMVSIGASVQNQISERFEQRVPELTSTKFKFVNLAQPAKDINDWLTDPNVWTIANNRLEDANVLNTEVQVIWLQDDILNDDIPSFPATSLMVKDSLISLINKIKLEFPKVKHIFISGRPYTGFSEDIKHDEPKGYYNGFAAKWLVEDQIAGLLPPKPWICDAIYMWTNGVEPRLDGFFILPGDYNTDGVHLSGQGKTKFGDYLFEQLTTNQVSSKYVY